MASKISLKRFGTMPLVPVPRAVRAGDYIFTSSVYPVDEAGRVVGLSAAQDEVHPSLMEIQARHCLESLKKVVVEAGASMDGVLKADVHLVDSADFYEFKLVWSEYFPSNPPARTTVEVGDTLPFHGARLNIDAVALASDSSLKWEVLNDPEGADPIEAEGASHAVRAGNLVFCSGFTASDFKNGLAVGKRPGFPNYGSDAEMQAEYVFTRMNRVLKHASARRDEAGLRTCSRSTMSTAFGAATCRSRPAAARWA
jgi:2-iminobutanoate/2-iminopropanoate deaminase